MAWVSILASCGAILIYSVLIAQVQDKDTLGEIRSLACSPDGKRLAAGHSNGSVSLWDASIEKPSSILTSDKWTVESLAFSHDSRWLASVHREGNESAYIRIWDVEKSRLVDELGPADSCTPVTFYPDKAWVVWVTKGNSLSIWSVEGRKEAKKLALKEKIRASALAFAPKGAVLAIAVLDMESLPDNKNAIVMWDCESDRQVSLVEDVGEFVEGLEFSKDGNVLGGISRDTLRVWRAISWKRVLQITNDTGVPAYFAINPEGKCVSIGWGDGRIQEYKISEGGKVRDWVGIKAGDSSKRRIICYDPKGKFLAYTDNSTLKFRAIN